jgi:hypothetical protein
VDLPIECSFLIPLIKCWESLVCLFEKTWVKRNVMEKTWKVTLLIDTPYKREKYLEGSLSGQTLSDVCSLDDGSSPRIYSQKIGAGSQQPTSQPSPAYFYV